MAEEKWTPQVDVFQSLGNIEYAKKNGEDYIAKEYDEWSFLAQHWTQIKDGGANVLGGAQRLFEGLSLREYKKLLELFEFHDEKGVGLAFFLFCTRQWDKFYMLFWSYCRNMTVNAAYAKLQRDQLTDRHISVHSEREALKKLVGSIEPLLRSKPSAPLNEKEFRQLKRFMQYWVKIKKAGRTPSRSQHFFAKLSLAQVKSFVDMLVAEDTSRRSQGIKTWQEEEYDIAVMFLLYNVRDNWEKYDYILSNV